MKRLYIAALAATIFAGLGTARAQLFPDSYINVDWQMGMPINTDYADKASGWGLNFEGGYRITDNIAVGAFISYQTNIESVPRETLDLGGGAAMTTNQKHTLFQLPFGVTARYSWFNESVLQPYVGLKVGAAWSEMSSYYYIVKQYDDSWGFFTSPEVGVTIFPRPDYRLGIHVALYYSYATNRNQVLGYKVDGMNNLGLRVGIAF